MAVAAPYAAMVMDARSGEILHARNADTRLHPASLTKMMTLYVVFEAIRKGEISLDSKIEISRKAAAEQPSKLGLKSGQSIELRYLIRAAAVKSANDAATALGEAISGSEAAFAGRMTRTARALGMRSTTFKNAHGLTENGHLSTARDMTVLGRHLLYDYPQYYNLFSRQTTHAGIKQVANTNRRLLSNYKGADGIKTGYTRAAGFNLVSSAKRGNERIIATVFGGRSSATRNARIAELLDMGFERARPNVRTKRPKLPTYTEEAPTPKTIKVKPTITAVLRSPRPLRRPETTEPTEDLLLAMIKDVGENVSQSRNLVATETPQASATAVAPTPPPVTTAQVKPRKRPATKAEPEPVELASNDPTTVTQIERPKGLIEDTLAPIRDALKPAPRQVITRASTSGGRHWGISLGRYNTRHHAERLLLQTALQEIETLDEALRKVVNHPRGWEANFVGMNRDTAELACARLNARGVDCSMRAPGT